MTAYVNWITFSIQLIYISFLLICSTHNIFSLSSFMPVSDNDPLICTVIIPFKPYVFNKYGYQCQLTLDMVWGYAKFLVLCMVNNALILVFYKLFYWLGDTYYGQGKIFHNVSFEWIIN